MGPRSAKATRCTGHGGAHDADLVREGRGQDGEPQQRRHAVLVELASLGEPEQDLEHLGRPQGGAELLERDGVLVPVVDEVVGAPRPGS